MIKQKSLLYGATFTLAMCSILYELVLAQTMAALRGNSILRYNITIGLYCAALGAGALCYDRLRKKGGVHSLFVHVEFALSLIGAGSTVFLLFFDMIMYRIASHFQIPLAASSIQIPISVVSHGMILLIGFLSGIELPLLMEMGREIKAKLSNRMLVTDYIGTFAGTVLFPLVLLPMLGVFFVAFFTGLLNIVVAIIYIAGTPERRRLRLCFALAIFSLLLAALLYSQPLQAFLMDKYCF